MPIDFTSDFWVDLSDFLGITAIDQPVDLVLVSIKLKDAIRNREACTKILVRKLDCGSLAQQNSKIPMFKLPCPASKGKNTILPIFPISFCLSKIP